MKTQRFFSAIALIGSLTVVDGCGHDIAEPVDDGLRLEIEVAPKQIQANQPGTITIRLQNLRAVPATINFSSTCQLLTFVHGTNNNFQYPPQGGYGCGDMLTSINLLPYEQRVEVVPVYSSSYFMIADRRADVLTVPEGIGLPIGRYAIRAELGHNFSDAELRSHSFLFEVR